MNYGTNFRRGAAVLACAAFWPARVRRSRRAPRARRAPPRRPAAGSRTIAVPVKGGKSLKVPASRIKVEGGATCQEAYGVIRGALTKHPLDGWTYGRGNFKVPPGLTAEASPPTGAKRSSGRWSEAERRGPGLREARGPGKGTRPSRPRPWQAVAVAETAGDVRSAEGPCTEP